jgi:hypothetical protein
MRANLLTAHVEAEKHLYGNPTYRELVEQPLRKTSVTLT